MSNELYVRNAVVRPNFWKRENFFETKKDGFVAASQEYETPEGIVLVVFKDRQAGLLIDSETGKTISNEELKNELAQMNKDGIINDTLDDVFGDAYLQIGAGDTITDRDSLEYYGISNEQMEDIEDRMADLENYYEDTVEDM